MVWRFLKHYGVNKATEVLEDFTSAVVAFDPETASKAQIAMMEAELKKLGNRLAEAEAEVQREHRETQAIEQSYQQYLQAAQLLQGKLEAAESDDKRAELELSLTKVVEKLEQLKPEIERERQEDQEVELWRTELRSSFEELAQKVRQAQGELTSARRQMEMARLQKQRADQRKWQSQEAAGLSSSMSSLSVALDAMNRETAKVRTETEALKLKADLFKIDQLDSDPNVAMALAQARGSDAKGKRSLADRLAALTSAEAPRRLTAAE